MKSLKQYVAEGRPSQRHPLEGHEYHKKTDAELVYIAKDAHKAAEAMKSHNTAAENKYRDQANDSATVRYFRQKNGMPDWYKKKYGHVKEEVEQIDEIHVPGTKVKVPHMGKMVFGKVIRHDKGEKHGSPFYVVDVGTYESPKVPAHQVQKEEVDLVSESAEPGTVIAKHGDVEVHRHESDEDGSVISVRKNGKKIADGDYDRHASAFFVSHKSFGPGQKAFGSSKDVAHHFSTMKEEVEQIDEVAAWQRKEGKSESGGLNRKGVESYRRENPGSKLSTAVTTEPSKLKPGSKAANRRKSFCARMGGLKRKLTSSKTANDPNSRVNKSLRKWNC